MEGVDCIVVGGGLAGLSAAYGLASAGAEVMVLERGDCSGSKNVTGGRLYLSPLEGIYPELWPEAPFERAVARELVSLVSDGAETTIETSARRFVGEHPQSFTVVRAKLDRWLAERAAEKGAVVVPNMKVDELLCGHGSNPRVTGIRAGEDEIAAGVVVIAEGVLGLLSTRAGLRPAPEAKDHALGFKEVIELAPEVIEDRWHLRPGEGAAHLFVGSVTDHLPGGGFLYTNRDSISLGLVVTMDALRARPGDVRSWQLLDQFKQLPTVASLISGGTSVEYSAHAIAEGGIAKVPRLSGGGYVVVGDAAGLSLNALVTVRGMDFAIASGFHAAETVAAALAAGDTTAAGLAGYDRRLRESFVLGDLETARAIPRLMSNPRLFAHYPEAVCSLMTDIYTISPLHTPRISQRIRTAARADFVNLTALRDVWSLRKV